MTTTGKVKEQVTGVKTVSGLEPSAVPEIEGEVRRLLADTFAERARKFGANTLRSVGDITRHQRLQDSDREHVEPEEMLKELLSNTGNSWASCALRMARANAITTSRPPVCLKCGLTRPSPELGSWRRLWGE